MKCRRLPSHTSRAAALPCRRISYKIPKAVYIYESFSYSEYEKLLGVTFDKKLNFTKHVQDLCKKAHQQLHALARLSEYIDPIKLKLLMDAFIRSQFNYCPLVWMFHDREANVKLNKVFERAMRIACNDSGNNFANKSLTIHQRNLQLLMTNIQDKKQP